jgi:hypothetical protein
MIIRGKLIGGSLVDPRAFRWRAGPRTRFRSRSLTTPRPPAPFIAKCANRVAHVRAASLI